MGIFGLWAPLALLAAMLLLGLGPVAVLGRAFRPDARCALVLVVGLALVSLSSQLVVVGLEAQLGLGSVAVVSLGLAVWKAREVGRLLRSGLAPLVVGVVVVAVCAVPFLDHDDWSAATFGNVDPYLWVSQARSFVDGPPQVPASDFPDRVAYERVTGSRWPAGVPVAVAGSSLVLGRDPVSAYGAFAVALAGVLALAVYVLAAGVLDWGRGRAVVGSVAAGLGGYTLYSTYYGWQAQIGLTALALVSLAAFRLALDRDDGRVEAALAGMLAGAAVALYSSLFAAFLPVFVAVVAGWLVLDSGRAGLRKAVRVVGISTVAAVLAGVVALARAASTLFDVTAVTGADFWDGFRRGTLPDAVGLIAGSEPAAPRSATALAIGFALLVLVAVRLVYQLRAQGLASLGERADFLVSGAAAFALAMTALAFSTNPYLSLKMQGYAAPFLTLAVFAVLSAPRLSGEVGKRLTVYPAVAVLIAFGVAAYSTVDDATGLMRYADVFETVAAKAETVDAAEPVAIDTSSAWAQAWLVYFLRDRPVAIVDPSIYFDGMGSRWNGTRTVPDGAFTLP
jgi:hypothetical protein